jgi:hypothetical protein
LQEFRCGSADRRDQQYARICADMQRFGNFGAEVPETRGAGSISAGCRNWSTARIEDSYSFIPEDQPGAGAGAIRSFAA